ncbi:MAG: hypothetical protein RJQ09_14315 [Cyclobacteriaceae bacterium]
MNIKLIWDFRGPDARGIAEHYKIHLDEYALKNHIEAESCIEEITGMYCTAWMTVSSADSDKVKSALRPHREEN